MNYYNEFEPYAAQWLRNLIAAGHLPAGEVDTRSITDVDPDDLRRFRQCHLFAGIGGWALAARLAGWPDYREIWTGSPPCQPFSVAGKGKAQSDDRHLWPDLFRLIRGRRPSVVFCEQVAASVSHGWIDGVFTDLGGIDYACEAAIAPACAVNSPHRRDRIWFVAERVGAVANASGARLAQRVGKSGVLCALQGRQEGQDAADDACTAADSHGYRSRQRADNQATRHRNATAADDQQGAWHSTSWLILHDRKARRIPRPESGIHPLANGVPARVGRLRAYGNAIVPQVAAQVIAAYMDCRP